MTEQEMVLSADRCPIAVYRQGSGTPVVFVHGTAGDASDWSSVADELSVRFRTIRFDRRGRGSSGDGPEYSIDREIDDVRSVVEACGEPVVLVGHSFGAVVALVASPLDLPIDALVLYEPPIGRERRASGGGLADELDELVAAAQTDEAVRRFVGAAAGSADHVTTPPTETSPVLRDAIRTAGREIRAAEAVLPPATSILQRVEVPVLVLLGKETGSSTYAGVEQLARDLPNGVLRTVPGGHLANLCAPEAVAERIAAFIDARR